ncbi:pyridoxal-phosphate dependent enzyme [Mesorhizobium caraganae]|uniref:pyridoxal-phosphate dependent enzyme n=1 Tax=Mesorhizobium caraganae TaxID=483206 RepID=UPI00193A2B5C|nr:pyridoxal-phosphate dependent enzyme [Mesorhizobium caraganae]MBM2712914.1 pyridoxal-phosphate dependent enzyme [Mesorhizobium caraganae]
MPNTLYETAANVVRARARIHSHIFETPLIPARKAGKAIGAQVLFKAENFQLTGSFKIRGAMSKISAQAPNQRLITASSGNHGIGAAHASKVLFQNLTVVLPVTVVPAKLEKIRSYGVDVILHGVETGLAEQHAQQLAISEGFAYISPYNDPEVIAGQGTIGLELLEQCAEIDNIFISMGGGGLIGGIASVLKAFSPRTKVYGIAASNSKALAESMKAGRIVDVEHHDTLADAVSGGVDQGAITLDLARLAVDEVVECGEAEIRAGLKALAFDENMIVEGSAALAFAGFNKVAERLTGKTSVILLCGANYDKNTIMNAIYDRQRGDT